MIQIKNKHKKQAYKDIVQGYKKVIAEKEQIKKEKAKLIQDLKEMIKKIQDVKNADGVDSFELEKKCNVEELHKHYAYAFCPQCGINLGEFKNEM